VTSAPRFWAGVLVGAVVYWYLYGASPRGTRAGVGGTVPKPLRNEGRLLRGTSGWNRPSYWPFGTTKG
jgi:hypothetical protein